MGKLLNNVIGPGGVYAESDDLLFGRTGEFADTLAYRRKLKAWGWFRKGSHDKNIWCTRLLIS